jgi:hypothetical protein
LVNSRAAARAAFSRNWTSHDEKGSRWTLLCRCRHRHQTLICWHDAPSFAASWLSKVGRRSTRSFAISVSASWASA